MAEGTVKTLTDRGFGFITPDDGQGRGDIFFHRSAVEGTDFEQLRTGDRVRYDTEEHLYFRDTRFISQRDANGRKIFWARGNGWVLAGLARILDELPAHHPSRPRYEALFKQMAAKIITLQGEAGYWPVSLLEPQATPETSGTGFFVYGLAWGLNHGLLPATRYRPCVDRGWHALLAAVQPDGKLGWVQRVGAGPDQVGPDDTQLYGVGAFLLAASEVAQLSTR